MIKQYYYLQFNLARVKVPSIAMYTNNSIKHQSFAYTQLNDVSVQFQAIQFSGRQRFTV